MVEMVDVRAEDTHRDDRNTAAEGSYAAGARARKVHDTIPVNSGGHAGDVMMRVMQVAETPRVNRKEFFLERVFDGSASKCHGKVKGRNCHTPVVSGSVQPGFDGIFVYYQCVKCGESKCTCTQHSQRTAGKERVRSDAFHGHAKCCVHLRRCMGDECVMSMRIRVSVLVKYAVVIP